MKTKTILLVALALCGCDKVVKTEYDLSAVRVEKGTNSCTHAGFCMCSYRGFKYTYCVSCPGKEPATHRVTPFKATYASGTVRRGERVETISVDGACR